jgi:myosin heavy subunit
MPGAEPCGSCCHAQAMKVIGISEEEQWAIFQILAAILHIGATSLRQICC